MGTRNLTCVVKDGDYKVAQYGQWDGYPEGQGATILEFLSSGLDRKLFESRLDDCVFITDEQIEKLWSKGVKQFGTMYPELSRDTGAEILSLIQKSTAPVWLSNGIEFAKDGLFCEWCYVIDLDKNTFEVYEGFGKTSMSEDERFYADKVDGSGYFPVHHVVSFCLDDLPTLGEFVKQANVNSEEE